MDRTTYGLDIAKNVMQLHWVEAETGEIGRKKLARAKLVAYFAQLKPVRIVMEACGSAHHWARVFGSLGHFPEGADKANGDRLAEWLVANADVWGVNYVIWGGRVWSSARASQGWRTYTGGGIYDVTSPTGGHHDHIHLSQR